MIKGMKAKSILLALPALLLGGLSSCGSEPVLTEVKALTVIPVLAELDTCAYQGLYSPIIETDDGTRYDRRSDFDLYDDDGKKLDWDEFGIRESVTLFASSDGKIAKGVVHGDPERSIYMCSGQTFYDSGYVFFDTGAATFLYSSNCTEEGYPKHVAMKIQGKVLEIQAVACYAPGCEVVYSPNPKGCRGYILF